MAILRFCPEKMYWTICGGDCPHCDDDDTEPQDPEAEEGEE